MARYIEPAVIWTAVGFALGWFTGWFAARRYYLRLIRDMNQELESR